MIFRNALNLSLKKKECAYSLRKCMNVYPDHRITKRVKRKGKQQPYHDPSSVVEEKESHKTMVHNSW
jgi:hypothetical protein